MRLMLFSAFLFSLVALSFAAGDAHSVVIYRSEACGHCGPYISSLASALKADGYTNITTKEYVGDVAVRKEMAEIQEKFDVPLQMQGHILTVVDGIYLFEGHMPINHIIGFLKNSVSSYDKIVVTQDSMKTDITSYLLLKDENILQCPVSSSIEECDGGKGVVFSDDIIHYLVLGVLALIFVFAIFQVIRK